MRATVATTAVVAVGGLAGAAALAIPSWNGLVRGVAEGWIRARRVLEQVGPERPTPATKEVPQ